MHRKESQLWDLTVKRRSIDARHKDAIVFSYTVTLCLDGEHKLLQQKAFQSKVTLVKASKQRKVVTFADTISAPVVVGNPAGEYITTNLIANVLGLGWACTPAGLKAMEQLAELEKQRAGQGTEKGRRGSEDRRYGAEATAASNEMCTFLILNISSLQLIPVNMIAYRSQYGSANPAVIIAPALVATLFSTIIAIIYCKWKDR